MATKEQLTPQERRARREARMKEAFEDFVARVRADRDKLLAVCPPLGVPSYNGRMQNELGNMAEYFLPVLEFRSGIPRFEPAQRRTVQSIRPVGWRNGNHALVREERELIKRNPEPVDFIPTMRTMGVLVMVSNVWDKSLTRMVKVEDVVMQDGKAIKVEREEARRGDWKVLYRFAQHTTPLKSGVRVRSWFHHQI